MRPSPLVVLVLAGVVVDTLTLLLPGCGGSSMLHDDAGSMDAAMADLAETDATPDAATGDAPITTGHHASIPTGGCISFATGTWDSSNPCMGDIYTAAGANVDLESGGSANTLCLLPGPYNSLGDIPRSYAQCMWTSYVEGGGGLAKEALIVTGSGGTHHYRVYIESNALPDLVIDWDAID